MSSSAKATPPNGGSDSIVLVFDNGLDCDALTLWWRASFRTYQVHSTVEFKAGLAYCLRHIPRLLVIEPSVEVGAIRDCISELRNGRIGHLLVLDSVPQEMHLAEILKEPRTSYFTRKAGPYALVNAVKAILSEDRRAFDPAFVPHLLNSLHGLRLNDRQCEHFVALLSPREREVMKALAVGSSVKDCAAEMGLSESTVDNHKARLMKKLGIHKLSELTCRAVQSGLIRL